MPVAAAPLVRRPLACCLQTGTLRLFTRFASTTPVRSAPAVTLPSTFYAIPTQDGRVRTAFAVYPPSVTSTSTSSASTPATPPSDAPISSAPSSAPAAPSPRLDVFRAYDQQQIARMDPTGARTRLFSRKNPDSAKPGDVLLVSPSRAGAESFAGVCLAVRRAGIETAILLRGQLAKIGVERWFKIYSRAVAAIDIIQRRPRRARRARLTYMRQPKHDRGAVDDLVRAWRGSRNVLRTRSSAGGGGAAAAAAAAAKGAKGAKGKTAKK